MNEWQGVDCASKQASEVGFDLVFLVITSPVADGEE
jgi:hypothetical protein